MIRRLPPIRWSLLTLLIAVGASPAAAQVAAVPDSFVSGRFDGGKMWTFEYPPAEYFSSTYDFDASEAWFERARMAALRIPGCSASFVSPNGLLVTNHHCVRGRVSAVTRPGERLLDEGFYAASLDQERPIPDYYADQLIAVRDVTDEVDQALAGIEDDAGREEARRSVFAHIEQELLREHASDSDSVWVQMIALYNGGRHSAYVFRRFTDVRLVMAVELGMGFFGGDPDNFTYPRYALDFAFLRVYDEGQPYQTDDYFAWGVEGVEQGDVVFVIGNPGPTTRLTTLSQLEFLRDVQVPVQRAWLASRHRALGEFRERYPNEAEALDVRNLMFSLSNSLKAANGRLDALRTREVMGKRRHGEETLRRSIDASPELTRDYGSLFERMADVQAQKAELADAYGAFYQIGNARYGSRLLARMLRAQAFADARFRGAPPDSLASLEAAILAIEDVPADLELRNLTARLADLERHLGGEHPIVRAALLDGTPTASAAALLAHSALASADKTREALAVGEPDPDDPALRLTGLLAPAYREFQRSFGRLQAEERELASRLGRLRFEVYGRDVPPDATFSPRITDGVVTGYEYNGTSAPPYTTFFGMYDRYYSHGGSIDWALPPRWLTPPDGLDLSTPLNFVSTADTYGGNSGSPAVTRELALVGLNFDRNVQGLSRDYIYLPERGRNVMVDVRAIQASLEHAYDAERLIAELSTGSLVR
jgi:hypothetical protein